MIRTIAIMYAVFFSTAAFCQDIMRIHQKKGPNHAIFLATVDSIYFDNSATILEIATPKQLITYPIANIDSISFDNSSNGIQIEYTETSVNVTNPFVYEDITVTANGTEVVVESKNCVQEISIQLSGKSSNGSFKMYSENRIALQLNGINLTNSRGSAINIQSTKRCTIILQSGTTNYLCDGDVYEGSLEDQKSTLFSEGQLVFNGSGSLEVKSFTKHAICSDDFILINDGEIKVTQAGNDGIHSNDFFKITCGSVNIVSAGDGIECEDGYIDISGGTITAITNSGDVKGIRCDSTMVVSGGIINLTLEGSQSKGIKSDRKMKFSGGDITINVKGAMALNYEGTGYNPSYSTAISCNEDIDILGGKITVVNSGIGGKAISSKANLTMYDGTLNLTVSGAGDIYNNVNGLVDSYSASALTTNGNISILGGKINCIISGKGGKGISCDGKLKLGEPNRNLSMNIKTSGLKFLVSGKDYCHPKAIRCSDSLIIENGDIAISSTDDALHSEKSITINGGNVAISNSTEGIESKFITFNGGNVSLLASNDGLNATFSTVAGGTESNDGSCIYFNGGYLNASTTKGDALDSNGNIVMTGGTVVVHGPPSAPEEAADFNGTFNMIGGFFVAAGTNSNMNKAMSSISTQKNIFAKTTTAITTNTIFRIQDSNGNDVVTFKPTRTAYSFLFSSPKLTSGTYTIYTGGNCSGTEKDGLYNGGSYTGGTMKKSFNISAVVTNVTF